MYSEIDKIILRALEEDIPHGDITSESLLSPGVLSRAVFVAKEKGIIAGLNVAERVFEIIDPGIKFKSFLSDGEEVDNLDKIAEVKGEAISLLKAERTALNFLQRLSGIASQTGKFVRLLQGTKTKILDTRKTTPGLRILEKYAVKAGGGLNHRFNLSEMVLIKDNHIRAVGSITEAVRKAREKSSPFIKIEIEVTNLKEVKEAVEAGADWLMLDNMDLDEIKKAVEIINGRALIEVSGKIDMAKVKKLAEVGVDFISIGSLTHSFSSLDISLEFMD